MNFRQGKSLWLEKNDIKNIYPYLYEDISCDVLVIGGGLAGSIVSWYMTNAGFKTVLVDKNIIGYGTTAMETGITEYQLDADLRELEKTIGVESAKKCYEHSNKAVKEIKEICDKLPEKCEFEIKDSIYYSNRMFDKRYLYKECESRSNMGFNVEFSSDINFFDCKNAIISNKHSAMLNPYKFVQEIVYYCYEKLGLDVYENTNIVDVFPSELGTICISNNDKKITAKKVIYANNIDAMRELDIPKNLVEYYNTYSIISQPIKDLSEDVRNFIAKDTSDPRHYMCFTNDNRIIYGGENIKMNNILMKDKQADEIAEEKYTKLYDSFLKTFPHFSEVNMEFENSSIVAQTKDGLPIIDEIPNMPNCYVLLPFGNNALVYSVIRSKNVKRCL